MSVEKVWNTADGRVLKVSDMETDHIRNCISMLKRKNFISPSTLAAYICCPAPTGDMASYYFEQELDEVFSKHVLVQMGWLEDELIKREGVRC